MDNKDRKSYVINEVIKTFSGSFNLDDLQKGIRMQGVSLSDEEIKVTLKSCVQHKILRSDGFGRYWLERKSNGI